jgi:hypothetical protein
MTKKMFMYEDGIGGYISVKLLHKAPKDNKQKLDIINCRLVSAKNNCFFDFVMTPHEAVMLSNGILNAVTEYACTPTKQRRRLRR